jgi:tetratricopeptide (TPR) repeat protein
VKSCRYWRRLNRPKEALRLSGDILKQTTVPPRLMAALLTTRGAAFRDMYDFEEAERCATEAIGIAPENFQPYNLMGAICMQVGRPEQGFEYFSLAGLLGAPRLDQARNIEEAVRLAEPEARKRSARFLLQKDPGRFQWAEAYLG